VTLAFGSRSTPQALGRDDVLNSNDRFSRGPCEGNGEVYGFPTGQLTRTIVLDVEVEIRPIEIPPLSFGGSTHEVKSGHRAPTREQRSRCSARLVGTDHRSTISACGPEAMRWVVWSLILGYVLPCADHARTGSRWGIHARLRSGQLET
jgi:hypothetical protein